jgi:hypothetical protein
LDIRAPSARVTFWAERTGAPKNRERIAALSPQNPFCDPRYVQWRELLGERAILVGLAGKGEIVAGCPAFLSRRISWSRKLELPTVPELPDPDSFWTGLFRLCRRHWITYLVIENNFGATTELPVVEDGMLSEGLEYRVDVTKEDLWGSLSKRHRGSIKKALKAGLRMREAIPEGAFREHSALVASSLGRHVARGERVGVRAREEEHYRKAVECGLGRLFQAEWNGRVVTSLLLIRSARGAQYHSGGTSPEGYEIGAGVFTMYEALQALRMEGIELINLARGLEHPGLALYKSGFGATTFPVKDAQYFLGGRLRKALARIHKRISSHSAEVQETGQHRSDTTAGP